MWSFKSEFFPKVDLVKGASHRLYLVTFFSIGVHGNTDHQLGYDDPLEENLGLECMWLVLKAQRDVCLNKSRKKKTTTEFDSCSVSDLVIQCFS